MEVPQHMHRFLIGKGGQTKSRLERDSGAHISIPQREDGPSDQVTLRSRDKGSIYSARAQIELLLEEQEEKLPFTHFLCFPLDTPEFHREIDELKQEVKEEDAGDPQMFMPTGR